MIAAKVAQRARARLPARAARADRGLRRLHRRDRRARARGRRRPRARAAARRQDPRAGRRRRARTRRDRRLLRRQRAVGAGRARARSSARSPTRASATPAARCASSQAAAGAGADNQEGVYWRYEMARARARVAALPRSPPATARSTRRGATPTSSSTRSWATTSRCPFNMVKRGLRAVYVPGARASEKMVPVARRRVRAQAAHDEPHVADRPARRHALAARLPARLRADDLLPPPAALLHARSCTLLALAANVALVAARRPAALYVVTLALQLALLARRARSPARCARARC